MGRTVGSSGLAVFLIILLAAILATSVALVAHALGTPGSPTVGSQSSVGNSGSTSGSTTTSSTQPQALVNGPDQSKAPTFPIAGGQQPGYGNFNAVACSTTNACLAVGADDSDAAVSASSADGGVSWTNESLPTGTPPLDAVACVTGSHNCVGVGQGVITHTSDGSHWVDAAIPLSNTTLIGANCPSTSLCVASGVTNNPDGAYRGAIVRSTDGGASWQPATLPSGTGGIGGVVCPSATDCIAVGEALLVSNDGGSTWSATTVPGGTGALRSITCATATQCVALGANPEGITDTNATAFAIVTNDGGNIWTKETLPAGTSNLDQISCSSSTQCVAAGVNPNPMGPAPLFESGDGGQSWAKASSSPSSMSAIAGVACPTIDHCAFVGRQGGGRSATAASSDLTSFVTTVVSGNALPPSVDAVP
jgi:photosystem II stability/assembly factor-like uncharacterized protein